MSEQPAIVLPVTFRISRMRLNGSLEVVIRVHHADVSKHDVTGVRSLVGEYDEEIQASKKGGDKATAAFFSPEAGVFHICLVDRPSPERDLSRPLDGNEMRAVHGIITQIAANLERGTK